MRLFYSPHRILATIVLIAAAAATLVAQRPMNIAPSGRATTEILLTPAAQTDGAGGTQAIVRIDYGQPHLRGRQLHTGDLVPYGEPWRLGANAPTTLMSEIDLEIGGAAISAGTYVLRAVPSPTKWTLLVEKEAPQSPGAPAGTITPGDVVARIDLERTTLEVPLESLTMWLIPSTSPGTPHGELRFAWGTTMLSTEWTMK